MTLKQKLFVRKYVEHKGNGTQAALDAYDTQDASVAHVIASENLRKPTVKKAIQQGWQGSNLRRLVLETSALPTELHPYTLNYKS